MSESELELQKLNHQLRAENEDLKRQLADFKRLIFGKKNERFVPTDDAQTSLFETSQVEAVVEEEDAVAITYEPEFD